MSELSHQTQAVLNAVVDGDHPAFAPIAAPMAAAALRAAADQVVPEPDEAAKATFSFAALRHRWQIRDRFLAIATELENHQ